MVLGGPWSPGSPLSLATHTVVVGYVRRAGGVGQAAVGGRAHQRTRFTSKGGQEQSETSQQGYEVEFEILAGHSVHLLQSRQASRCMAIAGPRPLVFGSDLLPCPACRPKSLVCQWVTGPGMPE